MAKSESLTYSIKLTAVNEGIPMRAPLVKNAIGLLLTLVAGSALAQFAWIDANGTRQYSDRPPPASIPKNKILKEPSIELRNPRAADVEAAPAQATTSVAKDAAATPKGPQTTAEKNADYIKRKTEQADKDKKSADEAKDAADKAKNCERAQAYNRSLQSGERISSTDKNGEKSFISDDKRAQEVRDTQRVLESCK